MPCALLVDVGMVWIGATFVGSVRAVGSDEGLGPLPPGVTLGRPLPHAMTSKLATIE